MPDDDAALQKPELTTPVVNGKPRWPQWLTMFVAVVAAFAARLAAL
jgi:hypothetical protein